MKIAVLYTTNHTDTLNWTLENLIKLQLDDKVSEHNLMRRRIRTDKGNTIFLCSSEHDLHGIEIDRFIVSPFYYDLIAVAKTRIRP